MRFALALAFALAAGVAQAQQPQFPLPLNQLAVDQQVSGSAVSSFSFVSPNSQRMTLESLTVNNGASAGKVLVLDAAALPSNGAVASCTSSATARPCVMWCYTMPATSVMFQQWNSPLRFTTGIIAAYSTGADCVTLTASATAHFAGQAP